jgi:hypothetical protein
VCLVTFSGFVGLRAADDNPPKKDTLTLVKELGNPSFQVREAAERQLKGIGFEALPAIKTGAASGDAKVAERCKELVRAIRAADAENFVAARHEHDSPAWTSFKRLVGDSKVSRLLFVDMMADDRRADAIERAEASPSQAHKLYLAELEEAKRLLDEAMKPFMGQPLSDDMSRAARRALLSAMTFPEVSTVLFLGRHPIPKGKPDPEPSSWLFSTGFDEGIQGPANRQACTLFGVWLSQRRDSAAIRSGLSASLAFEIKDAVPTARRMAADKTANPRTVSEALIVIGHYGTKEDLPLVCGFRKDARPTMTIFRPEGGQAEILPLGDIAAAMALKLCGEEFKKYGFETTKTNYWYIRDGFAAYRGVAQFDSEETRAATLKKAWDFLDRQPKAESSPP